MTRHHTRSLSADRDTRSAGVRSLASSLRSLALASFAACVAAVVATAAPAGAQQLVDAGKEGDGSGGLAFVLFAIMVMLIASALFFMDRVRRRAAREEERSES
jgi:hypothetical protein